MKLPVIILSSLSALWLLLRLLLLLSAKQKEYKKKGK